MLFRKTFRNAVAALLGLALALATGTAHAEINLDATTAATAGTVAFSAETFPGTSSDVLTTADGNSYYRLNPAEVLDSTTVVGTLGVADGTGAGDSIWVRYTLGNMRFFETLPVGQFTIPDNNGPDESGVTAVASISIDGGGQRGSDHVVFTWPATEGAAAASVMRLVLAQYVGLRQGTVGTITKTVHFDRTDARLGERGVASRTQPVAVMAQSLATGLSVGEVVATVDSDFTRLDSSSLGVLSVHVGTGVTATDGNDNRVHRSATNGQPVMTLAQVATAGTSAGRGSLLTFSGDFSVGAFSYNTTARGTPATCGRGTATALATRNRTTRAPLESVTIPVPQGNTSFCVSVDADTRNPGAGSAFAAGDYEVFVDFVGINNGNAAFPPASIGEIVLVNGERVQDPVKIGSIRRDGTRVQIPYLTTFEGYTQRVVIVNRNRGAVNYAFSFTPEDGTTAAAGEMATGSVPAGETMTIRATDIVTLTGKTRTAATLDVVAAPDTVDVATTQVNRDTQGTDTVVYEALAN